MPEPTLAVKKADLDAAVARFLGYGTDPDDWTDAQADAIRECRQSGERQFYHPAPVGGEAHDWSFLRPVADLTLDEGAQYLDLPDDFGGFAGDVSVVDSDRVMVRAVPVTSRTRQMYAENPDQTGYPLMAEMEAVRGTGPDAGQRWRLRVFPEADRSYTLRCTYYVHPAALTDGRPYAYGGPAHAETLKASCVAAAELTLDDERGPRWMYFQERLAASVAQDRRLKPQTLGYNADRSDGVRWGHGRRHGWDGVVVTFDGVTPD